MIDRFADIVQKSGTLGDSDVQPDLAGKQTGKLRNLNRMLQCVLTIACPKLHSSKQPDQFRMNSVNAHFQSRCLSLFSNHGIYFFLRLFYHLLNSCRMNTSVNNQFLQRDPCDLSSDRIKS